MDEELKQAGENLGVHAAVAMLFAAQDKLRIDALSTLARSMLADLDLKSHGHPDVYELTVVSEAMRTLESIRVLAHAIRDGQIQADLFTPPSGS
jgi:hypothetical protein